MIEAAPTGAPPPAPITAGQVHDLLSDKAGDPYEEPNLFVSVEPAECAGLAQEVDAPFIFGSTTPAAHDGGQWFSEETGFSIVEVAAVYDADFDAAKAVADVNDTIEKCSDGEFTATAMQDDVVDFHIADAPDSGVPQIALWSMDGNWSCDNAFIAAHNAAIELTACSARNGFDIQSLAEEALDRINSLADMRA